ncbi:MAG: GNAT family N-acetyltransferase [Erysipelotrichaceae bacterium]|nr:GNAT family N-acetyltransferase [Erysipelotrichaceae bacterium]
MKNETVRFAGMDDIALLTGTRIRQLDDEEEHPDVDIRSAVSDWFTENLGSGKLHQVIIEEDGRLIATGGLIALPIPPSFFKPQGRNGYILNMYTVPEKRHRGYASRVLHLLQEKAKEEGFEVIYLRTSEWGRPAYEKAGFQACSDWMDWTVR